MIGLRNLAMTKEEKAEYDREYRKKNKKKISDYHRQYRIDNADKLKEQHHEYYVDNKESQKETNAKWREANPDKVRGYQRKSYENNKAQKQEYSAKYRKENKQKIKESNARYYVNNKAKRDKYNQEYSKKNPGAKYRSKIRRRDTTKQLVATLTQEEWQKILDDHFYCCHYCGKKSDSLHQEHKIPVSKGGGWTKDNIVPSCASCNSSKHSQNYKKFVKNTNNRLQLKLFED